MTQPIEPSVARVQAFVLRAPIAVPVQTSFGIMRDRPALLVSVTDSDGAVGWGEVWCNFPAVGAEHRARLIDTVFAELLLGKSFASPQQAFRALTEATEVLAIQAAEPGPIAQCIAGLDIALWDLAARRAGQPLWRLLGGERADIAVYASGLNPTEPQALAARRFAQGHRAFKLKVGFGAERDRNNLTALRAAIGPQSLLAVDANQAWTPDEAQRMGTLLAPFGLAWLEEPLRADRPWSQWRALADACPIPLAAGENIAGEAAFEQALSAGALRIVQPDIAKWGGLSAGLPLARAIRANGLRYFPHYLGGGVGLLASAHLLAAVGGDGMLEVDANENPLRSLLCGPLETVRDGRAQLDSQPGLGVTPDPSVLRRFAA